MQALHAAAAGLQVDCQPSHAAAGASDILGLEVAGVVLETGKGADRYKKGDKVFALLDGGGYAEYAVAPEGFVMPLPEKLSFQEAAAVPEVGVQLETSILLVSHVLSSASVAHALCASNVTGREDSLRMQSLRTMSKALISAGQEGGRGRNSA